MRDFSVIVPTYGRPESLEWLLRALAQLDYPADRFEVIVVDDGGLAELGKVVSTYSDRLNLVLLRQVNAGPAAARNRGARQSQGRYLVFTDDDCQPEEGWLKQIECSLAGTRGAVCGGRTAGHGASSLPEQASQLLMDYLYEHYNPIERPGAFFPTNNMAAPREGFLELGGFDETLRFGEDRDFCYRWQSRGLPFVFSPEAVVRHTHRLGFLSMLALHFRYGEGTCQFRRASHRKGLRRVDLSSPLWYVGLVLHGMKRASGWRGVALSLLLLATQAASAAGLLWGWLTAPANESIREA